MVQLVNKRSSWLSSFRMIGLLLMMASTPSFVDAHGYLKSPRARNFIAYQDGTWTGNSPEMYPKESCPHCLNLGGSLGECGVMGEYNYTFPKSRAGTDLPPNPEIVVEHGSRITLEVVLTAHHKGHFEFKACPMSQSPIKECFEKYKLNFVRDELHGASLDPNYPERAYIPPSGKLFRYTLQLPQNLPSGNALLQWHYVTANSCAAPGYNNYNFPSAWDLEKNGMDYENFKVCKMPLPPDGRGLPEQFWNCAEISVLDEGVPTVNSNLVPLQPAGTPLEPTPTPGSIPVPVPVPTPVPTPVSAPTPTSPPCGYGNENNGVCANPNLCCSKWGWCDNTPAHCNGRRSFRNFVMEKQNNATTVLDPLTSEESDNDLMIQLAPPRNQDINNDPIIQLAPPRNQNSNDDVMIQLTPLVNNIDSNDLVRSRAHIQSDTQSNCRSSEAMKVNIGYYQSWAIGRPENCNKVEPSDLEDVIDNYTHLIYSFASISIDHRLEPWGGNYGEERILYQQFNALKENNNQLKTLIAVGGWSFNENEGTKYRFSDTAATPKSRSIFANSAVQFCREYGFDGVDLDWEYPGDENRGGIAADYNNYVLLVQAIREAFNDVSDELHLELSMAVPISSYFLEKGYNLTALKSGVDYFNIMAYDLNGSWSSTIGAHTNINTIMQSMNYFLEAGVPSHQLVLGLALHGRTYVLEDMMCNYSGCPFENSGPGGCAGELNDMPYFTIQRDYIQTGEYDRYVPHNSTTGSAVLIVDGNIWIDFDSEETLRLKINFAEQACLGGIMWWAIDMLEQPITFNDNDRNDGDNDGNDNNDDSADSISPALSHQSLNDNMDNDAADDNNVELIFPVLPHTPPDDNTSDWTVSKSLRCGVSEIDARGNCRQECTNVSPCPTGQWCWIVRDNYCDNKPQKPSICTSGPQNGFRCGISEFMARETCGQACLSDLDCTGGDGERCYQLHLNFCHCHDEDEPLRQRRNLRLRRS